MNVGVIRNGSSGGAAPQQATSQKSTHTLDSLKTADINEFFKGPKVFENVLNEGKKFNSLLANMGELPIGDRDTAVTRNLVAMVNANATFVQNPDFLAQITRLIKNIPAGTQNYNGLMNAALVKIREHLVKNRGSLNLVAPEWGKCSEVIRDFCNMISANYRSDFFKSLDSELLDFVLGKYGKKSKPDIALTAKQIRERQKRKPLFFEKDDPEANSAKADEILKELLGEDYQDADLTDLVSDMFSQVGRLEPELVSAVMISLVKNLPYGRFSFSRKEDAINWLYAI